MNFVKKWYIYQKERFPVLVYGIYVFVIVFATFCVVNDLSVTNYHAEWIKLIPMFIVAFLQFLMIRIVDEFKDYEEDCKYRAYRPVPRGLIKLKELRVLFAICALLQLVITILTNSKLIILLLMVWIFFSIMSKGFFIKKYLDKHLLAEVALDELLMPILVLYLSAFPTESLYGFGTSKFFYIFLAMTYIVSWIVEVARKVRCKDDEEKGVKTYTAVLGIKRAMLLLFILETILMIGQTILLGSKHLWLIFAIYIIVSLINLLFAVKQDKKSAKLTELSANTYIIITYLSMILLIV